MPQPTGGELYISRPLTNISVAYMEGQNDFIADKVFPPVPVDHQYSMYYKYKKGNWFRTAAQRRAPRTESAGSGWELETDTYRCEVQAVHTDVADQDRANQDRPVIDLDRDATEFVTRDIMLRREKDWVTAYFGTGIWTGLPLQTGAAAAGANQFIQWDRTSATPLEDIESWRIGVGETTGLRPNVLVIGARVYSALKNSDEFIERVKYTQRGIVTLELMAAMWDLEAVYTPMVVENTAEEGQADDLNYIYGKSALLVYRASRPGLKVVSGGYVFEWTGYLGDSAFRGTSVSKFRMQELKADRVEVESAYDFKVVASDVGVFAQTVVQ
jgi:hypothetical protein